MTRTQGKAGTIAALVAVLAVAAGCGKSADDVNTPATTGGSGTAAATGTGAAPAEELSITSPAPTGDVSDPLVWGVYRETNTLDPIFAFDYPENTVLFNMCEAVLKQAPDGSIGSGVGDVANPDPTTFVITLKDGVTFWDGKPVTADDVVYSLGRAQNPELGGFYPQVFARVKDIKATGPLEVTITMTEPDYWFRNELSGPAGVVLQQAFVEAAGEKFGTVDGGTMCSGPYKLDSWKTGEGVTIVKNDAYWDPAGAGKVAKVTFKGYSDDAALTSAFLTGELDGYYPLQLTTLDQLRESPEVKVYEGPSAASDAMIISSYAGVLGDVRVRKALSMAIDRQPLIDQLYKGAATLPRALSGAGSWGYAPEVFQAAWDALPEPTVDLEAAKALIKEAGAEGKTVRLGTSGRAAAAQHRGPGRAVGRAGDRPEGRAGVDVGRQLHQLLHRSGGPQERRRVLHRQLLDYADPAALLSHARPRTARRPTTATTTPGDAGDGGRARRARRHQARRARRGGCRRSSPTRCCGSR